MTYRARRGAGAARSAPLTSAAYRILGGLEALDAIMLFGLTTAFMYGMIQRVRPIEQR
jgi:hypothetical protein